MNISYMKAERCPGCGNILDYFDTFSTTGKVCRVCGWKKEVFTGVLSGLCGPPDDPENQSDKERGFENDDC